VPPASPGIVVVGAGQAGAWVARTLRGEGYAGSISLIGQEARPPYARPPLSKEILDGADDAPGFVLLDETFARDHDVALLLGQSATAIHRAARRVELADGRSLPYHTLFLTTGSRARRPPWAAVGADPAVHVLRTFDDALALRGQLIAGRRLLIVGGGWIGLEVAAAARKRSLEVVVVEVSDRLCARSAPPVLSDYLLRLHQAQGVEFRFGATVSGLKRGDSGGLVLTLADGASLDGDLCVIGVGNEPNTELAQAAGLSVSNGIEVDLHGRTSDPDIYAAGDVTRFSCPVCREPVRRESWANAQNQAIAAAKSALGQDAPYQEAPWLWSDQFGANIQILGAPERGLRHLARGNPSEGAGTWLSLHESGAVIGAVSINAPRDLRAVRKALSGGPPIDLDGWPRA
jgi:3-phenylpropionate/trans-cinnamate dioxygenase ferredoxin reductase subunit